MVIELPSSLCSTDDRIICPPDGRAIVLTLIRVLMLVFEQFILQPPGSGITLTAISCRPNRRSAAPTAIPTWLLWRQPERRPWSAAEGPSEGEPQLAAPSTYIWPGAPADGKIKNARPGGIAGGGQNGQRRDGGH
ncbi:hypothetical protein [Chitinophaga polysaccharea]|uniref:hypothetical protein n=1 Tax=Chitinophaga polysaccharea TaxID=1293035 RepID=UPI0011A41663|nr:hypothetical protein [Chitinophaga polysaccharea]